MFYFPEVPKKCSGRGFEGGCACVCVGGGGKSG